ncbi:MAG: hypothetical protein IH991_05260 [Planctomycetes bacterium]|nr:hypothetical protein [Planctomycetota bacterium]
MKQFCFLTALLLVIQLPCAGESQGANSSSGGPRWEISEPITDGPYDVREVLVFEGKSTTPFLCPSIHDFRLERLEPRMARIPLVFGRDTEFNWPKEARTCQVIVCLSNRHAPERIQARAKAETTIELFAQTWLEPGVRYRLAWSSQNAGLRDRQQRHCEFQIAPSKDNGDDKRAARPFERAYLCEVLYRHDGIQFLGRTVRPRLRDRTQMPAVGFTADGEHVAPPDPGFGRIRQEIQALRAVGHPELRQSLALTTHEIGVKASDRETSVWSSDVGESAALPQEFGKATFTLFSGNIYRIELLATNTDRLRQDHDFWKRRTKQISDELKARIGEFCRKSDRDLAVATAMLRDPLLIDEVRGRLRRWIREVPRKRPEELEYPRRLLGTLAVTGSSKDAALLDEVATASFLAGFSIRYVLALAERIEPAVAKQLICQRLDDQRATFLSRLDGLPQIDPSVPKRVVGDQMLQEICRKYRLDPARFNMLLFAERRLELDGQAKLTEKTKRRLQGLVESRNGSWFMPSVQARKTGLAKMKEWLAKQKTLSKAPVKE